MKASLISNDRLNWRSRPSSRLAPMKAITSGCCTSRVAICAPRRPPAEEMVLHIWSKISMNDKGPEVCAFEPATQAPRGRSVEKS